MTIDWQHMSIPLGQGLETRASEKVLPAGKLTKAVNVSFKKPGAFSKRPGLADDLGFGQASGDALATLGNHLLARSNKALFDYQPGAKPSQQNGPIRSPGQSWKNLGTLRSVPAASEIVKGSLDSVKTADAYAVSGLRCVIWVDADDILMARVVDELTDATISEQSLGVEGFSNQVVGAMSAGVTKFFILADTILWTWTSATNSWSSQNMAVQIAANFSLVTGTLFGTRICICGVDIVLMLAYDAGLVLSRFTFAGAFSWARQSVDLVCVAGPVSIAVSENNATVWAAACVKGAAPTDKDLIGAGFSAASGIRSMYKTLEILAAAGFFEHDGTVATKLVDVHHVTTFAYNGRAAFVWDIFYSFSGDWYADDYRNSYNKKLRRAELSSTGIFARDSEDWIRGLSLSSDGMAVTGAWVLWTTYAQLTIAKSITGLAETSSLNASHLLIDYSTTTVCAKLLAQQALEQRLLSSISQGLRGVTSAVLAVTKADVVRLALQRATVAVLTADFSSERMRSAVAQRDLVMTGGSPTDFDGVSLSEQGFFVYPELRVIGKRNKIDTGEFAGFPKYFEPYTTPALAVWTASTKYRVGDLLVTYSGNQYEGGSQVTLRVALTSGISGAVEPVWPINSGERSADGAGESGIVWVSYYLGRLPVGWVKTQPHNIGDSIYITSVNALLTVTIAGTTGATPPDWLTFNPGDAIVDGTVTYIWTDTVDPTFFRNGIRQDSSLYTSGVCAVYEWVDEAGQLHQSEPSVVQSFPVLSQTSAGFGSLDVDYFAFRYSYLVSTLRTTRKSNVYIAIYRTADDGTVLQKIGQMLNDPTVDALVFNDDIGDAVQSSGIILYTGQEGAGEFPNVQACSCSLIKKWGHRVVTNDLENPTQIRASKLLADGFGPAWSNELVIPVNGAFGPVTAFEVMDDKLVIFHAEHIGILSGDGPDNTGAGQAFPQVEYIATDAGCINPDSVVVTPNGVLFQSGKGLFGLSRSLEVGYSGAPVENASTSFSFVGTGIGLDMPLDAPFGLSTGETVTVPVTVGNIVSADIAPKSTEVRFLTDSGAVLVYDYVVNEWSVWTYGGADAIVFDGEYVVLSKTGQVIRESPSFKQDIGNAFVAVAWKIAALRLDGVQGFGKIRHIAVLMESSAATAVEFKIYDDYSTNSVQETAQFSLTGPQQVRVRPTHSKTQAVAIEFIEVPSADVDLTISGLDVLVGLIGKLNRVPAANRMG